MGEDRGGEVIRLPVRAAEVSADDVLEDMLEGWGKQQLSRNFKGETIRTRQRLVRRFVDHSEHFPWEWNLADVDDFFAHARSISNLSFSTVRSYQTHLKLFCDYLTDPAYEWDRVCLKAFGRSPSQVITEANRARHVADDAPGPAKRPFTRRELQDLFDLADLEIERVIASGRKGAVAAYRDAVLFKAAYAWGLRANEVTHLQAVDFSRNPRAPQFGDFGVLAVRYGKAQRGSPHKRRSVLTVFDWSPAVMQGWIGDGLPHLNPFPSDLFPTSEGLLVPKSNLRRRLRATSTSSGSHLAWTCTHCGIPTLSPDRGRRRSVVCAATGGAFGGVDDRDLHHGRGGREESDAALGVGPGVRQRHRGRVR